MFAAYPLTLLKLGLHLFTEQWGRVGCHGPAQRRRCVVPGLATWVTGRVTLVCSCATPSPLRLGGMDAQADMPDDAIGDRWTTATTGGEPTANVAALESLAAEVAPGGTLSVGHLYRMIKPPAAAQRVPEAGPPGGAWPGMPKQVGLPGGIECSVGQCLSLLCAHPHCSTMFDKGFTTLHLFLATLAPCGLHHGPPRGPSRQHMRSLPPRQAFSLPCACHTLPHHPATVCLHLQPTVHRPAASGA